METSQSFPPIHRFLLQFALALGVILLFYSVYSPKPKIEETKQLFSIEMNSNMNIQGLRDFLISTSTKLRSEGVSNENTQLNIVLGNESADLDSILSAILYAYYKQLKSNENEGIYVPIVNVPQEDLSLRKELLFLLKPSHIEETSIVCIDQFNKFFPSNQFNSNINSLQLKSVVLVDHNRLIDSEKEFTPIVTEVIDHHADETHFLPNLSKKVIETVGSCTTLLSEIFLNDKSINIDNQIAKLLLATILVDTVNFDESAKKTTAKDVDMATLLTKIANVDSLSNDLFQKNLFDEVNKEKSNIDSFTTNELLRKDYKEWVITSNSNSNSYQFVFYFLLIYF